MGRDEVPSAVELASLLEEAERRRFEAEATYRTLLEQVPAAIYTYSPDLDGPTISMSPYIEVLLGVPVERFLEGDEIWDEVLHPEDRERAWADYESFLATGSPESGEYRYVRPDGEVVWIHDRSAMVRGPDGESLLVQGVMFDVTERKEAEERLAHLAYHDALTGLPNRSLLEEHLELAIERARRGALAVGIAFLDLDDFKPVNDVHGHEIGDELLRAVGTRVRETLRGTDLVARQGGDEFLVLVADLPSDEGGETAQGILDVVCARIAAALDRPFELSVGPLSVHATIGTGVFPFEAHDVRSLLRRADASMYARKHAPGDDAASAAEEEAG